MGAAGGGRATGREHSLATPSAPPGSPRAHQLPPPPFLQELELLQDGDGVFKLMGPALVKQDREEAVATVRKRLDYIAAEVARLQAAVKEAEAKGEVLQAKARACGAVRVRGWGWGTAGWAGVRWPRAGPPPPPPPTTPNPADARSGLAKRRQNSSVACFSSA